MRLNLIARAALTIPLRTTTVMALFSLPLCAAQRQDRNAFLEKMAQEGSVYDPAPTDNRAPFSSNQVLNEYWLRVQQGTDDEKEAARWIMQGIRPLINRHLTLSPVVRYHIAAAALAAEFAPTEIGSFALAKAVETCDITLAKILVQNRADANARAFDLPGTHAGVPHLFLASTVAMADLLMRHGASPQSIHVIGGQSPGEKTLLYYASENCNIPLMQFYRNRGISPLMQGPGGMTCLHAWIKETTHLTTDTVLQGVNALTADLSPQDTAQLFFTPNKEGKIVTTMMRDADAEAQEDPDVRYIPYGPELINQVDRRLIAACAAIAAEATIQEQSVSPKD